MSLILLAAVLVVIFAVFKFYANVRRYPNGPLPLPLIGNLHQFPTDDLQGFFEGCHKVYGSVFTVFTPRPLVVIMEYEHIKEALITRGDDYIGRSGTYPDSLFQNIPNGGVIFAQGDDWREQRRTSIQILRDFGMGKNVMEGQVASAIEDFLEHLQSLEGAPLDFRWPIQILVANVINNTLFGYHYKYNDCERLMNYSNGLTWLFEQVRKSPLVLIANWLPIIGKLPFIGWKAVGQFQEGFDKLREHVREDLVRCMATYDADSEPECFVHAYMQKAAKNDLLNEEQMLNVCFDFFVAGMETTSTTLRWAMLFMADTPDAQEKIREEIHRVVGRDRLPTMADRANMPYTCAAINELQRMANILPLNVAHRTVRDTQVAGKSVPGDTIIMPQIYNVLKHSPVYADKNEEFRPERFLAADGKTPNKEAIEQHIPFSMGRRQCAGEGLARMELFLGLTAILQRYRVAPQPGQKVNLKPVLASVLLPQTNLLRVVRAG